MINVNLIKSTKLGKIEKLTLLTLLEPKKDRMSETGIKYPDGNDMEGIAESVFGGKVLNCERPGGHYCTNLSVSYSAKSSLSRTLHTLWLKGFVKRCRPIYRHTWHPADSEFGLVGFYGKDWSWVLRCVELSADGSPQIQDETLSRIAGFQLPHRTHVWWRLTERGRGKALELKGSNEKTGVRTHEQGE